MVEYRLPISYLDTGRVARDKINDSFNEVVQQVIWYRPHIESWIWWIWATNTWVKAVWDSIEMKKEDWYIRYKSESQTQWTQIIAIEDIKWDPWTDAWEYMTQLEYNALTPEQKMDWTSRAIYSDEEFYFKTALRSTNNILHYNNQDELYADLQIENWLTPTSVFPIWVSVGNVDSTDGRQQSWLLVNSLTTSGNYIRWLYGDDGKLYFDGWTGVFEVIATTDDITSAVATLRNDLATVAFTWKSSDLDNDADFNSVPVMTMEQYEQQTGTAWDDKRYFIYEE
jgi:hypothetical protein